MIALTLAFAVAALPSCLTPAGSKITAADIASAVSAFRQLPPDLVVGYSPQPGFTRTLAAAELAQWLTRHQVAADVREPVCFQWPVANPNPEAFRTAMTASLPEGARLTVLETSRYGIPAGELVFPIAGLQVKRGNEAAVWKGFVRYAPDAKFDVWARVEAKVPYRRIVAVEAIRAGVPIQESMIRLEEGEGNPQSPDVAFEPLSVMGRSSRRLIPVNTPVLLSTLDVMPAVRKGDTLHVSVLSGAARIAFDGIAQAAAAIGEAVPVKSGDTGKVVQARVLGGGKAIMDLTR